VDHEWIREHTRLGALARRWDARGRTDAQLLRGDEVEAAATWMASRPHGAPELSDDQIDFISSSKAAADAADRAARNRRRGLLFGVSTVAIAMAGLAGFSALQWQQAEEAKDFAVEAYELLTETNDELQGAYIRLSSDIALRAPSTGRDAFETKGGWFPVAANFAGAVVRLQQGGQIVTGILIDGAVIHPDWAGTPYVLTPRFQSEAELIEEDRQLDEFLAATDALGAEGAAAFEGRQFSRAFVAPREPGGAEVLENLDQTAESQDDLSLTSNLDDETIDHNILEQRYLTPEEQMPTGATASDISESPSDAITATFPTLRDAEPLLLNPEPVWRTPLELAAEPVFKVFALQGEAPFGTRPLQPGDFDCQRDPWGPSGGGRFALFGIDGLTANEGGQEELTLLVTSGLDVANSEGVTYRHATLKGAFGAPVFDLDSGKVIAIHQGVDANRLSEDGRVGFARPIVPLIEFIREDVGIDHDELERVPPICL
ncbi:MAG: hypothetical protein AAGA89_13890, partial [Pseudomonadota bacterium]